MFVQIVTRQTADQGCSWRHRVTNHWTAVSPVMIIGRRLRPLRGNQRRTRQFGRVLISHSPFGGVKPVHTVMSPVSGMCMYMYVYLCIGMCMYMYVCIYMHVYVHVSICLYMYVYEYVSICIHMYMYVYVHVYRCIYVYAYSKAKAMEIPCFLCTCTSTFIKGWGHNFVHFVNSVNQIQQDLTPTSFMSSIL